MADPAISHALVDADGRLLAADGAFADLNGRAGGGDGALIAVPQVAVLARLAGRLGTLVSRGVIAADGDDDVEIWVRAQPEDEGVRLTLSGWRRREGWHPHPVAAPQPETGEIAWQTDASLRLTQLSASAEARWGIELAAVLGHPLTQLFGIGEEHGDARLSADLADRSPFEDRAASVRFSSHRVRLTASPRYSGEGGFLGYAGVARTEEEPIADAADLPPDTLPSDFAGAMVRALRGPLGRIIANADSINAQTEGPIANDYVGYAADIANAGRHLLGLLEDLVDVQVIEREDFRVTSEKIDLADVARRAAGLLQLRAGERHVRIVRPAEELRLPARGEFRRVLQILVNLIGNAVRYSPDGGSVVVRCEGEDDWVRAIVSDDGKGIAIEDQDRIFEKFERVDTSEGTGSGLGLYIARHLARAMGGEVTVRSAPENGATFTLSLPVAG